ncbi:HK97 family phage prohead protease [Seohaeicola sp.]|uniref:HK97 family phage prohead protease n=1 Tax=Seohaeicola sp. TaxID=2042026 RepID=UPI0007F3AF10|nr:peptidase U35 [Rhodobacteraceae bacterium EhC02]
MDMELERKFCQPGIGLRLTTEGTDQVIEGYASLFDAPDQGGDVVARGAYAASLKAMAAEGRRVRMLWQHDPAQPIGLWDEVTEDARGLRVKGRLLDGVARGREAAALIAAGAIEGLSIGYRTIRATKTAEGHRLLTELDLWEVSVVTFPMLPSARVAAKADGLNDAGLRDLATLFREGRQILAQG